MSGMKTSFTSESTTFPKAVPITTPTARSTTLPRRMNFLNSSKNDRMGTPVGFACRVGRVFETHHATPTKMVGLEDYKKTVSLLPTLVDSTSLHFFAGGSMAWSGK